MKKTLKVIAALVLTAGFVSVPAMACTYVEDEDATKYQMVATLASEFDLTADELLDSDVVYFESSFTPSQSPLDLCPERLTYNATVSVAWLHDTTRSGAKIICQATADVTVIDEWTEIEERVVVELGLTQCFLNTRDGSEPVTYTTPPIMNY